MFAWLAAPSKPLQHMNGLPANLEVLPEIVSAIPALLLLVDAVAVRQMFLRSRVAVRIEKALVMRWLSLPGRPSHNSPVARLLRNLAYKLARVPRN